MEYNGEVSLHLYCGLFGNDDVPSRCAQLFQSGFHLPKNPQVHIYDYVVHWYKARLLKVEPRSRLPRIVQWRPPSMNEIKVNVDGSCMRSDQMAAGGLVQDANANWIVGFTFNIGTGNPLLAEIWGLYIGIKLAWQYGYTNVVVECDS